MQYATAHQVFPFIFRPHVGRDWNTSTASIDERRSYVRPGPRQTPGPQAQQASCSVAPQAYATAQYDIDRGTGT
jgi:hypothetical protein